MKDGTLVGPYRVIALPVTTGDYWWGGGASIHNTTIRHIRIWMPGTLTVLGSGFSGPCNFEDLRKGENSAAVQRYELGSLKVLC